MQVPSTSQPIWYGTPHTQSALIQFFAAHRVRGHNVIIPHRLRCTEIGYVEQGRLQLILGGRPITVPAGHLVVIPPEMNIQSGEGVNAGLYYWIGVSAGVGASQPAGGAIAHEIEQLSARLNVASRKVFPVSAGFVDIVHRLFQSLQSQPAGAMLRSGLAWALAGELFLLLRAKSTAPTVPLARIAPALTAMHSATGNDLHVDELAARCGISRAAFNAAFRAATGESPRAYFVQLKIERARELLREPALSITQITHRLGFSSTQYFASVFRRLTGQKPSDYRRGRLYEIGKRPESNA